MTAESWWLLSFTAVEHSSLLVSLHHRQIIKFWALIPQAKVLAFIKRLEAGLGQYSDAYLHRYISRIKQLVVQAGGCSNNKETRCCSSSKEI